MADSFYAQPRTQDEVRDRMLPALPAGVSRIEGSVARDMILPVAVEISEASFLAEIVSDRGFISTAPGISQGSPWLDRRGFEHGVTRKDASVAQTDTLAITGTPGTVIPAGTRVATEATVLGSTVVATGLFFAVDATIVIDATGNALASITAEVAGAAGNVPAGAITLLMTPIDGVASVQNLAALTGGADVESDDDYRNRVLFRVRNPASSGNKADYIAWAMDVTGVGAAGVVPVEDGPGTVSVYVTGSDGLPASAVLVDQVQLAIAPPWALAIEAEAQTVVSATGVSSASRDDASGGVVEQMAYNATPGVIEHQNIHLDLPRAGIWEVRPILAVANSLSILPSYEIAAVDLTTAGYCETSPGSGVDAIRQVSASEMSAVLGAYPLRFYWNGTDHVSIRSTRLVGDGTAIVAFDRLVYRSMFSKDDGTGKAPIGASVTIKPSIPINVEIGVLIEVEHGFDKIVVRDAITANIKAYFLRQAKSLTDRSIRFGEIARQVVTTPGVYDYTFLTVNGKQDSVLVDDIHVAVLGAIVYGTWGEYDATVNARGVTYNRLDAVQGTWNNFFDLPRTA